MSALWLMLITFLPLSCTAVSGQGNGKRVWKTAGGNITIQCRSEYQEYLVMHWGLEEEEVDILFVEGTKPPKSIAPRFKQRLETNGNFPNLDITIRNLTLDDTGAFWCKYKKMVGSNLATTKGNGSILLVVKQCVGTDSNFVVIVCALICGAILLVILIISIVWIIPKIKASHTVNVKPQRNDVYEDMRATLRR
ncbi:uncharacterized protein ACJ7VT_022037 isoform 2-T2 [Polymixia lowei]